MAVTVSEKGSLMCKDCGDIENKQLAFMAFEIFLIREFEQNLLKLAGDGCVHGPVHTSIGEEACAAGAMAALQGTDKIASTHRAHHHYLAKLLSYYQHSEGFDPQGDIPAVIQEEINTLMGEIMGLKIGCCGGRGGSMHLRHEKIGVIGTNAIVAGGVPLATGAAFAAKYRKSSDVVVCFLGDGAINQGAFHEAANLAEVWQLPIVYFVENNQYAVATSIRDTTATADLADKAAAYGFPGVIVDGMDPCAVAKGMSDAVAHCRAGKGAIMVEAKCYRFPHHAGPVDGSSFGYREKEEEKQWQQRDAHSVFPAKLIEQGVLSAEQWEELKDKAQRLVKTAVDNCAELVDGKLQVRGELWPKAETVELGLHSDGKEFEGVSFKEVEDFGEFETIGYSDAIAAVTGRWLEKDDDVFVVGEEIANFGGGPYGATKGLPALYPDRVRNTPISEAGFVGLAGGAAMSGLKPIVEIMFPDFALVAADQLFNQLGKLRHMYGNSTDMPVVVRTRIAIGCGYGGQHSMDPVGIFSLFSGWKVVAPSNAFDYIGLFNSAMRSKNPVLMVEHHALYSRKSDVPKGDLDYYVEIGKAKVVRKGSDVTVVSYSVSLGLCMEAAQKLAEQGIDAELIDLRTLSPGDIDYDTIGDSLKKTGILVIVEQAPKGLSIGAKITDHCQREFFDYLDGPIVTVAGRDIPSPVSKMLEATCAPSLDEIKQTIFEAAKRQL
ncbi:MAG: hypothetical protein JW936_08815 [Sedimentisphaerales bacterium]|nr:hypothetical protein [Sedimentisphaerales bacterium]